MEDKGTAGDEPGYNPTSEDLNIWEVYGDWVHANPGTHLDGGIRDDLAWQAWWRDLAVMPSRHYDAPSGRVGRRFVGTLGVELKGVRDRLWNSERFIVFKTVILPRSRHVTASQSIRRRIGKRFHAGGGHATSVWEISHRLSEGGDGGAPGTNIPQPGAPWKSLDGGAVDNLTGDERITTTRGPVHEDGRPGDGSDPRQTPRGPDTDRGESGLVP